jgi:hypothetical protein
MADAEDVRRLALALPHVEEIDCDGFDFRVGGKGFVWSYPERQPGHGRVLRTDIAVLYVGDEAEKQALVLGEPALFFTTSGYDGWPLVMLRLDEVDAGRLAELITDAWRMRAPADIAAVFEESGLGTRPDQARRRTTPFIVVDPGYAVDPVHNRPPNQPRSPNQPPKLSAQNRQRGQTSLQAVAGVSHDRTGSVAV